MSGALPLRARRYAWIVGLAGMVPLGWALWRLIADPPHTFWFLLAGIALLSGPLCIRMHSVQATISVSEGIIFTAALLFGPAAATTIAVIDGLAVSGWSRHRRPLQVLFGAGEPAISVCLSSLLFYWLAGVPPLLNEAVSFAPLVLPLFAMAVTFFALNTVIAGTAVWLEVGGSRTDLLRQQLPHVAIGLSVSLLLSAALVQTSGNLTLALIVVLMPMLLASHVSSHSVAARLEDTNRHLADLRKLYHSTIETLAMAIDAKDQVTHGHIRRVQVLSTRVARVLGAPARDLQALDAAALLHDLGKLAVPEHILNKPGPLTPVEYDEMKKHAPVGAAILSAIEFPYPVVPIVRHHHENWDGTGYPDGLRGTGIPLGARILAVVDCYDALTSDRPYRRRMTHEDAVRIVRSRSGRMYDPAVVEAFMALGPCEVSDPEPATLLLLPARGTTHAPSRSPVARPILQHASAARHSADRRDGVAQFLATLQGVTWEDAGSAVATFLPIALPDVVAALYRFDASTHRLVVVGLHRGVDGRLPDEMEMGRGVTGWVAANRQEMANVDAELDLGEAARLARPPLRLCVSRPLLEGGELGGVLTVYSPYAFSEVDRLFLCSVADGVAMALGPQQERPGDPGAPRRPQERSRTPPATTLAS